MTHWREPHGNSRPEWWKANYGPVYRPPSRGPSRLHLALGMIALFMLGFASVFAVIVAVAEMPT